MINKTNIKDLIKDINYISDINKFKLDFNKGITFKFNGLESFYGYFKCMSEIVDYINNELKQYFVYSPNGELLNNANILLEDNCIYLNINAIKIYIGLISTDNNKIMTFDKISIVKNSYKEKSKIIYELFLYGKVDKEEEFYPIGSFAYDSYIDYLKSKHWKALKDNKLSQCNYMCQMCADSEAELHVHHNNYDNLCFEEMSDLIVLCKKCHEKFHDIEDI